MKGFSNQLIEKHRYLKALDQFDCSSEEFLLKVKHQFDELINLEQFLNIISLQPSAVKVSAELTILWLSLKLKFNVLLETTKPEQWSLASDIACSS